MSALESGMRGGIVLSVAVLLGLLGGATNAAAAPISVRISIPNVTGGITPPGGTLQDFAAPFATFQLDGDTAHVVAASWPNAVQLFGPVRITVPGVAAGTVANGGTYVSAEDAAASGVVRFRLSTSGFFFQSAGGHSPALLGFRLDRAVGPVSIDSGTFNNAGPGAGISFVADDGSIVGLRAGGQGTLDVALTDTVPALSPLALAALAGLVMLVGAFAGRRRLHRP